MFVRLFLLLTGADLVIKQYVENRMEEGKEVKVSKKLFLRKVSNKGLLLGKLQKFPDVVKGVSIFATVIVALSVLFGIRREKTKREKLGKSLILAGAVSNLYDRLMRGHVVDYIGVEDVKGLPKGFTANLADLYILLGTILTVFAGKVKKKNKDGAASEEGASEENCP